MAETGPTFDRRVWRHREDGSLYFAISRARNEAHDEMVIVFVPLSAGGTGDMFVRREADFLEEHEPVDADPAWLVKEWGTQLADDVTWLTRSKVPLVSTIMEMAKHMAMSLALYDDDQTRDAVMDSVVRLLPTSVNEYLTLKSKVAEAKRAPRH